MRFAYLASKYFGGAARFALSRGLVALVKVGFCDSQRGGCNAQTTG
jgi:hypothetical protein